jgi:hypothetical protein
MVISPRVMTTLPVNVLSRFVSSKCKVSDKIIVAGSSFGATAAVVDGFF